MIKIWGIVIGVHAALLVAMIISFDRPNLLWNKKPVVIRTVVTAPQRSTSIAAVQKKKTSMETPGINPKKPAPPAAPPAPTPIKPVPPAAPTPKKPAAPTPSPAPTPKKAVPFTPPPAPNPKQPAPANPAPPPPPTPKKEERPAQVAQQLLEELEASLTKIESKPNKFAGKKSHVVPKSDYSLQIDRLDNLDSKETEYQLELVSYLQEALHLPDYGEVKMEITLRSDGSVASLKVLEAESAKNRSYLEKSLPLLRFPVYDKTMRTFVLTFCNET